ncbi:MAG: hypothetical protein IH593_09660, partial [Bacteroidales bacterium]|nr:hypothetical protein [Bacteroidales bacterium]
MRVSYLIHFLAFALIMHAGTLSLSGQKASKAERTAEARLKGWTSPLADWYLSGALKIDSIRVDQERKVLNIWFPVSLSHYAVREDTYTRLVNSVKDDLGRKFSGYNINM